MRGAFYSCLKLFSHVGNFLFMLEIFSHAEAFLSCRSFLAKLDEFYLCWTNIFSTGKFMSPHEKPVVTCHHVIKKKATGKLFCHAGGPEKQ